MTTPVIAIKTLTVKAWAEHFCSQCHKTFDIEQHEARMAPAALFVVAPDEPPFVVMDDQGRYACPHCQHRFQDQKAAADGQSVALGKAKNKKVDLTLLVHPEWLRGSPGKDVHGNWFGGGVTDTAEATAAWNEERAKTLRLVEVRGKLPEQVVCPDTGEVFYTDKRGGTVPRKSTFICQESTCGKDEDILTAIKRSGQSGPVIMYAIQGVCPTCDQKGEPYGGRFFATPDVSRFDRANFEWQSRRNTDLKPFWPKSELPFGFMTHHLNGGIPNHGFTHWWKMFNPRQLLILTQLSQAIIKVAASTPDVREFIEGCFQQYLRNQNMFCIWNVPADKLEPMFSNNNFHPKSTNVENSVFSELGRGNWQSCKSAIQEGLKWCSMPWETVAVAEMEKLEPVLASQITGKSVKVEPRDPVLNGHRVECRSASDLGTITNGTYDLVITDPPFGGLLHYAELSDFFYVWLRLALKEEYPSLFSTENTPKALEAVANRARHPDDPDAFYQKLLTECWREVNRILKPSGILAFTFHHSEDEPWVAVLESLFGAGFYLEAAYPIRSDETKGEGEFGSRKIEFDIIHVCRKRTEDPEPISWAWLRRQIMRDVRQLQDILEQHQKAGLQEADLQVIRRGKALEYYSRHYGKVYIEKGREGEFTVKDALVGIGQLLDDENDTTSEAPPVLAEPYTRQFLRLFADRTSLPRDQIQKFLRGTGVSPNEFLERGWCTETQKVFHLTSPVELAQQWKGQPRQSMARDFDQAMFLVGSCYENSGIRVQDTLNNPHFIPHPATGDILDWLGRHGGDPDIKNAARLARQLYAAWEARNKPKVDQQLSLFGLREAEN